jgi:regulator of replication initiation timing
MEDIRKYQILEEIEKLSKDIKNVVIEKNHSLNMFNEKLKTLYKKLDQLYLELRRSIPLDSHNDGSNAV